MTEQRWTPDVRRHVTVPSVPGGDGGSSARLFSADRFDYCKELIAPNEVVGLATAARKVAKIAAARTLAGDKASDTGSKHPIHRVEL